MSFFSSSNNPINNSNTTPNKTVLAIPGSIRKNSIALQLIQAFTELAPENINVKLADISNLPMYNQDLELPEPDYLLDWKAQIKSADGVFIVTPEYNRSIPPVLKNALDWASRPQVPFEDRTWYGKPAAVAGYTPYSLGAYGAIQHLRQVLTFFNMPTLQYPEFYMSQTAQKFNEQGKLTDEGTIKFIHQYWTAFNAFMDRFPQ